ncbi:DMT family transporter [Mycolicibacterium sp.]|uniref:DMT family transporter n=1 Tax=Mycolicibacterium sp. TaxID=2320850 RepID=UPI003D1304DA
MAWLVLLISGCLEAVWATALARANSWRPMLVVAVAMPASLAGLAYAMTSVPAGTAYAVWVGVGATLTVLWAMLTRREAASVARMMLLGLLVGSVVGLEAVA